MDPSSSFVRPPLGGGGDYRRARRRRESQCCTAVVVVVILVVSAVLLAPRLRRRWAERVALDEAPAAYFPLDVALDRRAYGRHNLVGVRVKFVDQKGRPIREPDKLEVRVERLSTEAQQGEADGLRWKPVSTIGGARSVRMRHRTGTGEWEGCWPISWSARAGKYRVVASCVIDPNLWVWQTPEQKREMELAHRRGRGPAVGDRRLPGKGSAEAYALFTVERRDIELMAPGTVVATHGAIVKAGPEAYRGPDPDKEPSDWRAILEWAQFMGCDTLWIMGATSGVPADQRADEQGIPWHLQQLKIVPEIVRAAPEYGLDVGAWAVAYRVGRSAGTRPEKYEYALDAMRSTQTFEERPFISLLDSLRPQDLARVVQSWQGLEGLDAVGLDYMRTEQDYQAITKAAEETQMEVADDWDDWSPEKRMLWAARRMEVRSQQEEHPNTLLRWEWWRAHRTAEIVDRIRQPSPTDKPLWVFMEGWKHGRQHGQDPFMFADAGVDLVAVKLYTCENSHQFELDWQSWANYVGQGELNIFVGNEISDDAHEETGALARPEWLANRTTVEEFYRRLRVGTTSLIHSEQDGRRLPLEKARGLFIHDVSRLMRGDTTGEHKAIEWAIAGAAAGSELRNDWGLYPLKLRVRVPPSVTVNDDFEAAVEVTNVSAQTLSNVYLEPLQTPGLYISEGQRQQLDPIRAGQALVVPVTAQIGWVGQRKRYMVAFKATWPAESMGPRAYEWPEKAAKLPRQYIQFKYLKVTRRAAAEEASR